MSSNCPPGNLLAGKRPVHWQDIARDSLLVTDGVVSPEGASWDAAVAVILETGAATLTYDLGALVSVQGLSIQADGNDSYHLWGSKDGNQYQLLASVEAIQGVQGLRQRTLIVSDMPIRFLKFGEGVGDSYYSLSELQAFCQIPDPFPPLLKVSDAPLRQAKTIYAYWNNDISARWEMVLAALGYVLLSWCAHLASSGKAHLYRDQRDRLLATAGIVSFLTYFNFGFFHFPTFIHDWEWTHYYLGSKYFKELSYDGLYDCIAVADLEDGLRRRVELRKLTNLRTNVVETSSEILANPERCKSRFTEQRWRDFKHDVKFFRDRQTPRRWEDLQTDHGYNATPVWNVAGSLLANLAPASKFQLYTLAILDPLYLAGAVSMIWWAFGWRVTAVAMLVFATNFPSRFFWTGGAFLRWDWLFFLVASTCLLKKERMLLAGMALSHATLLRVFPVFMFAGPFLALGWSLWRQGFRTWRSWLSDENQLSQRTREYLQFFAGAAIAAALLIPLSLAVSGTGAYQQFVQNTAKHKETPLTNYMGLRTVVSYRPAESGQLLFSASQADPWKHWKNARLAAFEEARPVYVALVMGFLVLLGFAVRDRWPWETAALSATFIAIGVELTCYYYAFIFVVALLYAKDAFVGRVLLLLTAFTGFVDWAPLRGMPAWMDEKYTLMSLGTVVAFGIVLWRFGLGQWMEGAQPPLSVPNAISKTRQRKQDK